MKQENRKTHVFKFTLSLLHVSSLSVALFTNAIFYELLPSRLFCIPTCIPMHVLVFTCVATFAFGSVNSSQLIKNLM